MNYKSLLVLHGMYLFHSLGGIFTKFASKQPFFSLPFCIFYGVVLLILLIYAILWQRILKNFALTVAYLNKGVTIIWSIMWGILVFHERIKLAMIIGLLFILSGIFIIGTGNSEHKI